MIDDLAHRMRAADPAELAGPVDSARDQRARTLTEDIMSEATGEAPTKRLAPAWIGAAAALVAVVALGSFALLRDTGSGGDTLQLEAAGGDQGGAVLGSCIAFSPDLLAEMDLAFDGTVTDVGEGSVTLAVSHWYKGGSADSVELSVPGGDPGVVISLDGIELEQDGRYLISASDGTVSFCGFSGPWSAELESGFRQAFEG